MSPRWAGCQVRRPDPTCRDLTTSSAQVTDAVVDDDLPTRRGRLGMVQHLTYAVVAIDEYGRRAALMTFRDPGRAVAYIRAKTAQSGGARRHVVIGPGRRGAVHRVEAATLTPCQSTSTRWCRHGAIAADGGPERRSLPHRGQRPPNRAVVGPPLGSPPCSRWVGASGDIFHSHALEGQAMSHIRRTLRRPRRQGS